MVGLCLAIVGSAVRGFVARWRARRRKQHLPRLHFVALVNVKVRMDRRLRVIRARQSRRHWRDVLLPIAQQTKVWLAVSMVWVHRWPGHWRLTQKKDSRKALRQFPLQHSLEERRDRHTGNDHAEAAAEMHGRVDSDIVMSDLLPSRPTATGTSALHNVRGAQRLAWPGREGRSPVGSARTEDMVMLTLTSVTQAISARLWARLHNSAASDWHIKYGRGRLRGVVEPRSRRAVWSSQQTVTLPCAPGAVAVQAQRTEPEPIEPSKGGLLKPASARRSMAGDASRSSGNVAHNLAILETSIEKYSVHSAQMEKELLRVLTPERVAKAESSSKAEVHESLQPVEC